MSEWSLSRILATLHKDIEHRLETIRESIAHPVGKGDASEDVWIDLFNEYLPKRYFATKAHVVDSNGKFSEQIDVVICDRQYSPMIFSFAGQEIVPAESVYAVFEAKQQIDAAKVDYAQGKIASVRRLTRTSQPISSGGKTIDPTPPQSIIGGFLAFESGWQPSMGEPLNKALSKSDGDGKIDMGCIAAHGFFSFDREDNAYHHKFGCKPATSFLFNLISELQSKGTVPMLNMKAYAKWLTDDRPGDPKITPL